MFNKWCDDDDDTSRDSKWQDNKRCRNKWCDDDGDKSADREWRDNNMHGNERCDDDDGMSCDSKWHDNTRHGNTCDDDDANKSRDSEWHDKQHDDNGDMSQSSGWQGPIPARQTGEHKRTTKKAGGVVVQSARAVRARGFRIADLCADVEKIEQDDFKHYCKLVVKWHAEDNRKLLEWFLRTDEGHAWANRVVQMRVDVEKAPTRLVPVGARK